VESPEASAAVSAFRQAQSQLRQTKSSLAKSEADLQRLRDLYQNRAAPLKDMQSAENELVQSQAAVEQAQAAVDAAVDRLHVLGLKPGEPAQDLAVRAPISGKVLEIAVIPGEYRNDTSASLMTIADLSKVWVAAEVPESSIRLIEIGESVQVTLAAYPGEVFKSRVMRIADTVDPQTRTVEVQAEMDNPGGRFRPEMFGSIRHTHGSRTFPVVLPTAIVQGDGNATVFVQRAPGDFEQVPVHMGEIYHGYVPILSGLKAGDFVVVDGAVLLKGN
jgi:cobalt-zinc-cadmium efflux system membrane fusion protein